MRLKQTLILLLYSFTMMYFSSSCQRDDICAEDTPTTPLLVINFIDDNTVSDAKPPNELQIKAVGFDNIIDFEANPESISIPLRTSELSTDFEFTINSNVTEGDPDMPNTDTVSFQYTPVEQYVSSACGFRVTYNGLTRTLTPEENNGNWIKRITIEEANVTDETDETGETITHVLIFH